MDTIGYTAVEERHFRHAQSLPHSLMGSLREFIASAVDYFKARINLAQLEAKEAGSHIGVSAAMALATLVFLFFACQFLGLAIVAGLAAALATVSESQGSPLIWLWAALITVGVFILAAGALGYVAYQRFKKPVFRETINQMKKDQSWLHPTKTN